MQVSHHNGFYYKTTDYFSNNYSQLGGLDTRNEPVTVGVEEEDGEFGLDYIQPSDFRIHPQGDSSISDVYDKINLITGNSERQSQVGGPILTDNRIDNGNGMAMTMGMGMAEDICAPYMCTHDGAPITASFSQNSDGVGLEGSSFDDEDSEYDDLVISSRQDIAKRSSRSNHSNSIELSATTEMLRIRFPYQSISIRVADFFSLREKDFINDTIVDFYLNHIVEHVLPDDDDKRVTVLPAIFWHNLSLLQNAPEAADNQRQMSKREKLDARFGDVLEFVKDFELMNVDYIVIPVNEWEHWSVVIVCNPYSADGRIVCLDSQIGDDLNNIQNTSTLINQFLKYVWLRRNGREYPLELGCVIPSNLPQQLNSYDCGVYIGEFTTRFLLKPPKNLDNFDFAAEYPDFTIVDRRQKMQKAVLSLCANKRIGAYLMQFLEYSS
ncbi:hypothetical protein WR25_26919 [Diploscapter pachys]|uniref:Ubiquitin-like protease family profile domain-containing protein n=1 Tax=Diploscapter pachys TaxID=2018661 RepID=A0A2A2JV57_9BILA|nr:hypothetical protein WR25_26919 [Diploscapter pachys]